MPRPRLKLNVVIDDYPDRGSDKGDSRDLDIRVLLFMTERQMRRGHDVDNMLKRLLDGFQG